MLTLAAATCALAEEGSGQVIATLTPDRDGIYVNEPFALTLTVRASNLQLSSSFNMNGLPGQEQLVTGPFRELAPDRSLQGNDSVTIYRFRTEARVPQAGTLTLAPTLRFGVIRRSSGFFHGFTEEIPQTMRVSPLTLDIRALPQNGRPDDFSGAIGRFRMEATVTPKDVAVGDLVTLTLRTYGAGYLESMTPPRLSPGRNFKTYEPRMTREVEGKEKVFEQIIIPQSTNAASIPAVHLSFFDPRSGRYETLSQGPFNLTFHTQKTVNFERYRPANAPGTTPPLAVTGAGKPGATAQQQGRAPTLKTRLAAVPSAAWTVIAILAVLGLALIGLALRLRRPVVTAALFLIFGAAVFLGHYALRSGWLTQREATLSVDQTIRFAPSLSSIPLFELAAGGQVRVLETWQDWTKVEWSDKRGWIPSQSLATATNAPAK